MNEVRLQIGRKQISPVITPHTDKEREMVKALGYDFPKVHGEEMKAFFYRARTNEDDRMLISEREDGSVVSEYTEGVWEYRDVNYPGNPSAGTTVISYGGTACFHMSYNGAASPLYGDKEEAYYCLKKALNAVKEDVPWRGENGFKDEYGNRYVLNLMWTKDGFDGDERVIAGSSNVKDPQLFKGHVSGGYINL